MPVKSPWGTWVNVSQISTENWWYNHNKTKHNKTVGIFYGIYYINGLVQERRNSGALAMELRLSYTNPLIYAGGHKDIHTNIPGFMDYTEYSKVSNIRHTKS